MGAPPIDPVERTPQSPTVEVSSVGGRQSRPARAAWLAAVAVVALIGAAISSASLFPAEQAAMATPPVAVAPSPVASATASVALPPVHLTPREASTPLGVAALVAATAPGTSGRLALVSGRLHAAPRRCEADAPLSACYAFRIDGLEGVRVVPDDGITDWSGDPGPDQTLVVVAGQGVVRYLGSLTVDPAGSPPVDEVVAQAGEGRTARGAGPSLFGADGRLVRSVPACPAGTTCPSAAPAYRLFTLFPPGGATQDVTGDVEVMVSPAVGGLEAPGSWLDGPFLLRRLAVGCWPVPGYACAPTSPAWQVVAREDQASVLRIMIP